MLDKMQTTTGNRAGVERKSSRCYFSLPVAVWMAEGADVTGAVFVGGATAVLGT